MTDTARAAQPPRRKLLRIKAQTILLHFSANIFRRRRASLMRPTCETVAAWNDVDFAFRFHAVMLGVLADHLRLNRRCLRRGAFGACHHRRLLRQARRHLDATVIGETSLDGEARDAIVRDGVHEVAVAIRTYGRGGYRERIGALVHFQRDVRIGARVKPLVGVGQVDLGTHVAGLGIEAQGEAGYLADERLAVKAGRLDDGRIADVKMRYVVLRNVAKHPDRVDPLHREK